MKRLLAAVVLTGLLAGCSSPKAEPIPTFALPTLGSEDLGNSKVVEFNLTMTQWRDRCTGYTEAYAEWTRQMNRQNVSIETLLSEGRMGLSTLLILLTGLKKTQGELVPLVDSLIELDRVPEVVSGDVAPTDLRAYVEQVGRYLDTSRENLEAMKFCFDNPVSQDAVLCLVAFYASPDRKNDEKVFNELSSLHYRLFGQRLSPA